jgi:hypothetical protein
MTSSERLVTWSCRTSTLGTTRRAIGRAAVLPGSTRPRARSRSLSWGAAERPWPARPMAGRAVARARTVEPVIRFGAAYTGELAVEREDLAFAVCSVPVCGWNPP